MRKTTRRGITIAWWQVSLVIGAFLIIGLLVPQGENQSKATAKPDNISHSTEPEILTPEAFAPLEGNNELGADLTTEIYAQFAAYQVPMEQMSNLTIDFSVPDKPKISVKETGGCKGWTILDTVRIAYGYFVQFREKGKLPRVEWKHIGALFLSESSFVQYEGQSCQPNQNDWGAQAYCFAQIYLPAHSNYTTQQLASPEICARAGFNVYAGFLNGTAKGDPVVSAACYKAYCGKNGLRQNDPTFVENYIERALQAGGFNADGVWVSWDEEECLQSGVCK